jgi:hypothetical protein
MTPKKIALCVVLLLSSTSLARASGTIAVYALVENVIFEPNDNNPERIRISGAFALETSRFSVVSLQNEKGPLQQAQRGYLYFQLAERAAASAAVLKEWRDLKAIAGTGQAIAFGNFDATRGIRLRQDSEKPAAPDSYIPNVGLVKLGAAEPISRQLRQALGK